MSGSSDYAIKTILTANDAQLKAAFGDAGSAVAKLGRKLQDEANRANKGWHKFGTGFKEAFSFGGISRLGGMAAEGLMQAAGAVIDLGKRGLQLASDLTEVQNVVDTTFGPKNAEKINAWSKTAIDAYGLTELQAKKFNGVLGAMMKSSGISGDKIVEMSTKMSGLAGDFASFYNLPIDEAFEKIKAGISGETEPLKSLGINMSVANMEAFALTQGLTKQWAKMSQGEQTQLRYQYMMKASKDAQGDFSKTLETSFANQKRVLESNIDSTMADLMSAMLPLALDLTKQLNVMVKAIGGWVSANKGAIGAGVEKVFGIVGKVAGALGGIIQKLGPIFETAFSLASTAIDAALPVIDIVADTFKSLAPAIDFVAAIIKAALIPAFGLLKPAVEIVGKYINGMIMIWSQTIGRLIEGILQGVSAVGKAMGQDMSAVDGMITSLQKMRDSSTAAIFGPPEAAKTMSVTQQAGYSMGPRPAAPNAGKVGLQANTQVVNEINVSGIPGAQVSSKQKTASTASQERKAPALSGYGK